MSDTTPCPQCGHDMENKREGYCLSCWQQNQDNLDLHNISFDRWGRMTDRERDSEIRKAYV